jgi:hypothetical protein
MKKLHFYVIAVLFSSASWQSALAEVTSLSGAEYASLCQTQGVPLPPRWGEMDSGRPRWKLKGTVSGKDVFIVKGIEAKVYYYATSQGVCMALPRYNPGTTSVDLFGVICQGTSGKVCFWDRDESKSQIPVNPSNPISIASTNAQDLVSSLWVGGAALVPQGGGMCTDCHRGENPFIVVPGEATDLKGVGVSQFSGSWYDPIVGSGWLQNAGPGTVPSPTNPPLDPSRDGSCLQCHSGEGSIGGRFPVLGLINGTESGYCKFVLTQARLLKKMPPFDPGPLSYDKHWNALFAACAQPGPPTTITPPNSRRHALDPALLVASQFPLW